MVSSDEKKIFCDSLGISPGQIRVDRIPDPERRLHMVYRVWHPNFGEGIAQLEHDAWHAFFDAAQKAEPLPTICQAKTKKGKPCQNTPQKGERYCGPHLTQVQKQESNDQ